MKKQKVRILIISMLAIIALVLIFQNRTNTLKKEIGEFAIDDTTSVTKIYLADMSGKEVLLKKVSPGNWILNDSLKARNEAVRLLLSTMYRMAVQAPVSKTSYNNVISNLATNSVKVEVYTYSPAIRLSRAIKLFYRERLKKVYYVGTPTQDNLGTYMLLEGSNTPFIVYMPGLRGFISARFSANVNDWRDHTIFAKKPHQIKSIKIEFPSEPDESFRIEKSGRNNIAIYRLIDNQQITLFDTSLVVGFINGYRNIRFESLIERDAPINLDSILTSTPLHIITLVDTAGYVQEVKTYRRKNYDQVFDDDDNYYPYDVDRLYALLDNKRDFVLIQYFVFDPITRPLSFFLKRD